MSSVTTSVTAQEAGVARKLYFYRMQPSDLDEVLGIEIDVYPFPWTRGNFMDSIASGYETWVLRDGAGTMCGYFLLMLSIDDAHLLNITVERGLQGRRIGLILLDKARAIAAGRELGSILLEVRHSNEYAAKIYLRYGFDRIGIRKRYYPAQNNTREDAIVMRLEL